MSHQVNIIRRFTEIEAIASIESVLMDIRNGKYAEAIKKVREAHKLSGKAEADKVKKALLYGITLSGTFAGVRQRKNLMTYNGHLAVDFDSVPQDILLSLKATACQAKYSRAVFISPSGNGLKILVETNSTPENHDMVYREVLSYYEALLGIEADYGGGYGLERICYFSCDPNLFYNPASTIYQSTFQILNNVQL